MYLVGKVLIVTFSIDNETHIPSLMGNIQYIQMRAFSSFHRMKFKTEELFSPPTSLHTLDIKYYINEKQLNFIFKYISLIVQRL